VPPAWSEGAPGYVHGSHAAVLEAAFSNRGVFGVSARLPAVVESSNKALERAVIDKVAYGIRSRAAAQRQR
jgi:hypothetical protein